MTMPAPSPQRGLEPRLEAIYRRHHAFVWSSLLRLGVPWASVDDACQDVFLIVFRRLDAFEGRSRLRTWLFAIARRVAFRHRRGAERAERKARALAAEPTRMRSFEEVLENREAASLVLHALDELDDDKRTAVVLHVLEGMSGPQVASTLGLPLDTAYSRIKAGRRVLRRRLRALGIHDEPQLFDDAREQTRPPPDAPGRVAALLTVRLAGPSVTTVAVWKGLAAALALGIAATWVGARTRSDVPRSAPASAALSAGSEAEPERRGAAAVVSPPLERPEGAQARAQESKPVPVHRSARHRASGKARSLHIDRLGEEVVLIGSVKRALDEDRPRDAMLRLDDHARRFPGGELTPERRGYRAVALCRVGNATQGRGEARTFLDAHPQATLAARVRSACALEDGATERRKTDGAIVGDEGA